MERSAIRGSLSIGPGFRVPLQPGYELTSSFRLRHCERPQGARQSMVRLALGKLVDCFVGEASSQ